MATENATQQRPPEQGSNHEVFADDIAAQDEAVRLGWAHGRLPRRMADDAPNA